MAEEYSLETNVLIRRGWKRGNDLSKKSFWEAEVGDPDPDTSFDRIGLKEDSTTVSQCRWIFDGCKGLFEATSSRFSIILNNIDGMDYKPANSIIIFLKFLLLHFIGVETKHIPANNVTKREIREK